MSLKIEVRRVQHVEYLDFELELSVPRLTAIVGKNGVGKTTLIRSIRNLSSADTFLRTAARDIFVPESRIAYTIEGHTLSFEFDPALGSLNCKAPIPDEIRTVCVAELPMPDGNRFHFFRTLSEADTDIRRRIVLEDFTRPDELIQFLSDIYSTDRFQNLVEINIAARSYYCILLPDNRYVREDYLSSGEYFLISLYRTIKTGARLIAVDEIDLSLDAAAQVHLVKRLRGFCGQYRCNILFTTHSLAMMRTLEPGELLHMDRQGATTQFIPASYHYIRSLLFGFTGWDRYILTEDIVLSEFIEAFIQRYCKNSFFQYKIIHIGGAPQVFDLLRRNENEQFLSSARNVIAILDGDQRATDFARHPNVLCIPLDSVEKALYAHYAEDNFPHRLPPGRVNGPRDLFQVLQGNRMMSRPQIYSYLCDRNEAVLQPLAESLTTFLSH